ncbi:MAG: hypothetical protein ABI687_13790 [Flavitalea sp.]
MKKEEDINQAAIVFKEKRKWQIALRRYVVLKQSVPAYAPYFGLDIAHFREWIELQFDERLNWESFGKAWQFGHIVPVAYFDFNLETDLRLCWSFMNISVEGTGAETGKANGEDLLTAKAYFGDMFKVTRLPLLAQMIDKISLIERERVGGNDKRRGFIKERGQYVSILQTFSVYEYGQLNAGMSLEDVQKEREMLLKFGK